MSPLRVRLLPLITLVLCGAAVAAGMEPSGDLPVYHTHGDFDGPPLRVLLVSLAFPARLFPLAEVGAELAARGHTATLFVAEHLTERTQRPGLDVREVKNSLDMERGRELSRALVENGLHSLKSMEALKQAIELVTIAMTVAAWEPSREYLDTHDVDLLVCDFGAAYCPRLAELYDLPFVFFSPLMLSGFFGMGDASGIETVSHQPNSVLPFPTGRSLLGRAAQKVLQWGFVLAYGSYDRMNAALAERLRDYPRVNGDAGCANAHFWSTCRVPRWIIASLWQLEEPVATYPNVDMVGAVVHHARPALGAELAAHLDAHDDVLYVCLGTSAVLSPLQVRVMSAALADFLATDPSRHVLWSLPNNFAAHVRSSVRDHPRVRVEEWVPQKSVLAHEHVRAFVSQCGSNSMHDGGVYGKPTLCAAIFVDQHANAMRVARGGGGAAYHDLASVDEDSAVRVGEELAAAMENVHTNSTLHEGAQRLRYAYARAGGAVRVADILEDTVRLGDEHLIAYALREQGMLQRADVDVWAIILGVAGLLGWLVLRCVWACVRMAKRRVMGAPSKPKTE